MTQKFKIKAMAAGSDCSEKFAAQVLATEPKTNSMTDALNELLYHTLNNRRDNGEEDYLDNVESDLKYAIGELTLTHKFISKYRALVAKRDELRQSVDNIKGNLEIVNDEISNLL